MVVLGTAAQFKLWSREQMPVQVSWTGVQVKCLNSCSVQMLVTWRDGQDKSWHMNSYSVLISPTWTAAEVTCMPQGQLFNLNIGKSKRCSIQLLSIHTHEQNRYLFFGWIHRVENWNPMKQSLLTVSIPDRDVPRRRCSTNSSRK